MRDSLTSKDPYLTYSQSAPVFQQARSCPPLPQEFQCAIRRLEALPIEAISNSKQQQEMK
jgi:hypothetical protein